MPTHRTMMIREDENEDELRLNMDLIQERREATVFITPDESKRQWPSDEHLPERKTFQMSPSANGQVTTSPGAQDAPDESKCQWPSNEHFSKRKTSRMSPSTNGQVTSISRNARRSGQNIDDKEITKKNRLTNINPLPLNENDQDSLNAAAGGNLLSKTTREALNIIENKSKVRYSRNKSNVSRMNTTSRESVSKTDERIDKLADQLSTLVEIVSKKVVTPAPVKAVEEICVTCSGPHAWYNCPNTDNNQSSVCAATGTYNQVNPPNRVSNQMAPPGFAPLDSFSNSKPQLRDSSDYSTILKTRIGGEVEKPITIEAYEGPSIPTNPSPKKVVERETEETTDKEQNNFQGSTAHIPPPVNPIPIPEPDVPKTLPKPNIPYPS
ncbi:hypothetical protein Tco_0656256 [Tanacetum coccineum]|uniref:Reverse transcriptase domain-containing protein n=1 Tax=Tanacetum coccineum TaxID=301880 RepID=A0ABQ4X896_9ASTR